LVSLAYYSASLFYAFTSTHLGAREPGAHYILKSGFGFAVPDSSAASLAKFSLRVIYTPLFAD